MTTKILSRPIAGWCSVITSLRSRSRTTRRAGAGCAVRLPARHPLDLDWGDVRRRRPRHDCSFRLGPARRKNPGPNGEGGNWSTIGSLALISVLSIMIILLAVLALVVVQALAKSPWGVFTMAMTIPVALIMGLAFAPERSAFSRLRFLAWLACPSQFGADNFLAISQRLKPGFVTTRNGWPGQS